MTSTEIQHNVERIFSPHASKEEFIYDLLLAYGISKTSVIRLKKGDFNLSKNKDEVLYKKKVFFKVAQADQLLAAVEHAAKDEKITRHNPRFAIVTDYKNIAARDLKLGKSLDIKFKELPKYYDFFLPLAGAEAYQASNDNQADRNASYKMGELYDLLIRENHVDYKNEKSVHHLNIFLSRLLFCFFAEDTGIFEGESIFTNTLAQHTAENGKDTHLFLNKLFKQMNTQKAGNAAAYLAKFPYVNGGLFGAETECPKFSTKSRKILLGLGELEWKNINPDIFGSMIQAVVLPEYRSNLGMHYTSVPNILKLIKPLFLDELYEELEAAADAVPKLRKLVLRISKIKFLDPACGSGNFLIIAYKEIRLLEIKILQRIIELSTNPQIEFTQIQLSQFYGIELDDFAHEIAILSLWLAEHQMNSVFKDRLLDYGKSKPILPLKQAGKIVQGNAARLDWKSVCPINADNEVYVLGNPPYLGARMQDEEQKKDMDLVFHAFEKYKDLDYISIWLYKAKKYIEHFNAKSAFVSTNSVCQGQQVALLWPNVIGSGIEIAFAHLSFKWTNNAKGNAGVTVIILGLRNQNTEPKYLFDGNTKKEVKNINAYLLNAANVVVAERILPISRFPKMNFGNMPNDGGGLILSEEENNKFLSENPNAKKFIRLLLGSAEYIRGEKRYCLWIEDEDLKEVEKISFIQKRIDLSRKHRLNSKDKGANELAKRSHQFRDRNVAKENQLIVPRVSSERRNYIPCGYLGNEIIASDSTLVIYDAEPFLFAVVNSRIHMVWVRAVGGKLKTDYRYSAKLCYNTFPFPDISPKQKETLKQYVFDILDARAMHPEKTMAQLYDPDKMPKELKQAHQALDKAIEQCYRLQPFTSDTERLEYLFKMYEQMIATEKDKGTLFEGQPGSKRKAKQK